MRLFCFVDDSGETRYGFRREDHSARLLTADFDFLDAVTRSAAGETMRGILRSFESSVSVAVTELAERGRLKCPIPTTPAGRCLVTGTGLTHYRSAEIRDGMGATSKAGDSDSRKMYDSGAAGGRPGQGEIGAQPEWFYKGNGSCLVASEQPLVVPAYALSAGEEFEIAGVYYIDEDHVPIRIGFVLANDFSDHRLEEKNYLYVGVSKLRVCSIGPEILIGDLPDDISGTVALRRSDRTIWQRTFATGGAHMTHSVANLEHHHFKHQTLLTPGDIHIHLLGSPGFSYGDDITLEDGDEIEMSAAPFGLPLRSIVRFDKAPDCLITVRALTP